MDAPFDWDAARRDPQWRDKVAAPLTQAELQSLMAAQLRRTLAGLAAISDPLMRDCGVLAAHSFLSVARALVVAAASVPAAAARGMRLVSDLPELAYLDGSAAVAPASRLRLGQAEPKVKLKPLRRLARTASWTAPLRLPQALLAPAVEVVSHNALLVDRLQGNGIAARFDYGNVVLADHRRKFQGSVPDSTELAGILADAALADVALPEETARRARAMIDTLAADFAREATATMAALRQVRRLPKTLWSGTGGAFPARALGLEVARRGGQVVRFDHGGTTGIIDAAETMALGELSVSTGFIAATNESVRAITQSDAPALAAALSHCTLSGHTGDPHLRKAGCALSPRRVAPARKRVVYAPAALFGFRAVYPPPLPDVVYMDWQMRLAAQLQRLPIDLICKPHPGGILAGQPHPLAEVAPCTYRLFEDVMDEADVFVFDYPMSTTFGEALCSDRTVVFLDVGIGRFTTYAKPLLDRRVRTVTGGLDQWNRPTIDDEQLAHAILTPDPDIDPTPFRRLFAGEPD